MKRLTIFESPYGFLSLRAQRWAFALSLLITLALSLVMLDLGAPLRNERAPNGIISYEFSGNLATARAIVLSWGEAGRISGGLSLGLDYLYLCVYALALSLGCTLVARRFLARIGFLLAWGVLLAGLLDGVENWALIKLLMGSGSDALAQLAWACAALKFLLVFLALAYFFSGLIFSLIFKPRKATLS